MNLEAVICSSAVGLIVPLVLHLLLQRAKRPALRDEQTGELLLHFTRATPAIIGFGGAGLAIGLLLCVAGGTTSQTVLCVCALIGTVSVMLAGGAAYHLLRMQIRVSEESLKAESPFRRPRTIAWKDISTVRLSGDGALKLISHDRRRISVEPFMVGITEFEAVLRQRLSPQVRRDHSKVLERFRRFLHG